MHAELQIRLLLCEGRQGRGQGFTAVRAVDCVTAAFGLMKVLK